ncbi:Hypothetical protein CINCED_3A001010 [Cinara cedri]|uniref:Uncharacterized protein n=1 Tax=Cinara cedri TaxID=506608 RepID=A0A5E4NGE8_9HEMI|nr:Hypothetical protein CINCED_3A001010 [Cinara cedri]
MSADKFVIKQLKSINSNAKLFKRKHIRNKQLKQVESTDQLEETKRQDNLSNGHDKELDDSINAIENWKETNTHVSRKRLSLRNICPFNAVTVLITVAYTDNPMYQKFVDESINNDFLQFSKNLVATEPTDTIYKNLVSLLQKVFLADSGVTDTKIINTEYNLGFSYEKIVQ